MSSGNTFTDDDVLLAVKMNPAGTQVVKVGFIHVLKVVVDGNASHWTFNCYWQH
ncbi:MAG: hypothetical protein LIP08_15150 [Bacteroides sp.]|nr:hypothetical protein [Bacteroides sp.]